MKKEERFLQKLNTKLDPMAIENLAREVGFITRSRKIQAVDFIKAFCLMTFYTVCSLNIFATTLGFVANYTISKQAVAKRLTPKCVDFLRKVLFLLLLKLSTFKQETSKGVFTYFKRVLLQDSTNISLPKKLADHFPGSKNQSNKSTAIMKIQTIYDLLSEAFISFKLTPYTCNDQSASSDILAFLRPGDLVLRDLGYFALPGFRKIDNIKAFFISRYRYGTAIYDEQGNKINLLKHLRKYGILDTNLYLGATERLPVRLVAIPLPQEVASERKRKLRQTRDKRLNPSKEQLALLEWEIFITNVPSFVWDTKTVAEIYGIRWRIETIFKAWKSHFNLTVMTNGSRYHIETLIYAKLIWITLFQTFFQQLYTYVFVTTEKHLSLLKVAQFIQQNFWAAILILYSNQSLDRILEQCIKHCCYEKRKKRINYQEIMVLLSLS